MQDFAGDYLNPVFRLLNYNLFALGDAKITPLSIIYLLLLSAALIYISRKLRNLLITRVLQRTSLDIGAQQAIGTITRYFVLFVGFLIILQTVGINLTTLNVLAGAVGIGIGLGLQNIANNFISGLIILFERPIKVGDRIEVAKILGEVTAIGARSTRIKTNDNISIIVPNSKFISENVTNWSLYGNIVRFRIPVGVAYDSDIDLVSRLLIEVAEENEDIVSDPPPSVRLVEFAESALRFELRAWSRSRLHRPGILKSNLNLAIIRKFRENSVVIPVSKDYSQSRNGSIVPQIHDVDGPRNKSRPSA
ncbi:MAG TPA: mechanosensitive ion channel domain-containing protein [Pyrinomonadaceae bacterium]|jgi:small-conductance mechanosensitive channel|nr:mechanosensitive ion channel domain-containing protein [Pyrinomonadaceae bacterium]